METPEQRAERFRERAKKLRALAERTTDPEIKKQMLSMAGMRRWLHETSNRSRYLSTMGTVMGNAARTTVPTCESCQRRSKTSYAPYAPAGSLSKSILASSLHLDRAQTERRYIACRKFRPASARH
jgi:hypothetical protein